MLEEAVGGVLIVEADQNAVLIFRSIHSDNAHLKDVVKEGTTELAEVGVGHVIGDTDDADEGFASKREGRRGILVGEEMHEAAGLLDPRVSGGEVEDGGGE